MRRISLLLLFLLLAGCAQRKPNVLLVTFDTTRADHIGFISGRSGVTPNVDALARKGVWFPNAIASQPLTGPSHATILTGLYPYHHGVRNNGSHVLAPQHLTLAERLHAARYRTHAVIASFVLDSRFGFGQGFDGYDDDVTGGSRPNAIFKEIDGARVAEKALRWLDSRGGAPDPFFLWMHFYDPHDKYQPPPDIGQRFPNDPYAGEIYFADQQLGRVLERLEATGELSNTLIVFTADHGESLGEHGEKAHGVFVYDATTRVPLLFVGKDIPRNRRIDSVVSSADIVPTLIELLGLSGDSRLDGESLVPIWKDGARKRETSAYSESMAPRLNFGWADLRARRSGDLRVIEAPKREVYRLKSDPRELTNVYSAAPEGSRPLLASLQKVAREDPINRGGHEASAIDAESRARLAALGYLVGGMAPGSGPRADPKDRIGLWEKFQRGQESARAGSIDEAIAIYREFLELDPESAAAITALAAALETKGSFDEAGALYKRLIEMNPGAPAPYLARAKLLLRTGVMAEAEELARTAMRLQPASPDGYTTLGDVLLEQRRLPEAEAIFRRATEIDPNSTIAISGLGNALNRSNRLPEAKAVLTAGLKREPNSHVLTYNLGVVTERMGDLAGAVPLYERATHLEPRHSMTWNNLGSVLDRLGRREEAIRAISRAHELDPLNVEAAFNLGALLSITGRSEEAIPLLEGALRMRPSLVQAAIQRANALIAVGRMDEGIDAWREIASTNPGAWAQVARLELARGNRDAAKDAVAEGIRRVGEPFAAAAARDPQLGAISIVH